MQNDGKQKIVVAAITAAALSLSVVFILHSKGYDAKIVELGSRIGTALRGHATPTSGQAPKNGIRPVSGVVKKGYTKEQLAQCDGVKSDRVLVSLKMKVYEAAPHFYGPGQPYHIFAGAEASRALAKSDLTGTYLNQYWVNCAEEELEKLEEYVELFDSKYPVVGWFVPDDQFYKVTD